MNDTEMAQDIYWRFSKGYTNNFKDDSEYDGLSEERLDKADEMMDELKEFGAKAFREKYGVK